jgi:hypothetical protein
MKYRALIWIFLSIVNNLSSQTFETFQITSDELDYFTISDQSLVIDSQNIPHALFKVRQSIDNEKIFYAVIDTNGYMHLKMTIPIDTSEFDLYNPVSLHDYSLVFDSQDSIILFYYKEIAELDIDFNIINRYYQIITRRVVGNILSDEVILYETEYPLLNIEFRLDNQDNYHGCILMDGSIDYPELSKKLIYLTNSDALQDTLFYIDTLLRNVDIQNLCFEIDSNNYPHIFLSSFSDPDSKNYLNYWNFESYEFNNSQIDSIEYDTQTWFRSVKTVKNKNDDIYLIYLKDSIYLSRIIENGITNPKGIHYINNSLSTIINSIDCIDSLFHSIIYDYNGKAQYLVFSSNHINPNPIVAGIKNARITLRVDNQGFINGLYTGKKIKRELYYLKSKISLNPLPELPPLQPNLGFNDTSFCFGDTIYFHHDGLEIKWYINDNPIQTGDSLTLYYLDKGLNTLCVSETILDIEGQKDTATIFIHSLPNIELGPNINLCENDSSYLLDAGYGFENYYWNDSTTNQTLTVKESGDYFVLVTDSNNCRNIDNIRITFHPLPDIDLGNDMSVCDSIVLDAGNGYKYYSWDNGSATRYRTVTTSDLYFVKVTDLRGCEGSDSINIIVHPTIDINLGRDTAICHGDTMGLDPGEGFIEYRWNDSLIQQVFPVSESGTYFIHALDSNNCKSSDTINVIFNPLPVVDLGMDTMIYLYETLKLDAGPGMMHYLWSNNDTIQIISINGSEIEIGAHNFYVMVTDTNNCSNSDSILISVVDNTGFEQKLYGLSLTIYPNPTNNVISVSTPPNCSIADCKLFSLSGMLLISYGALDASEIRMDQPNGTYILTFILLKNNIEYFHTEKIILNDSF